MVVKNKLQQIFFFPVIQVLIYVQKKFYTKLYIKVALKADGLIIWLQIKGKYENGYLWYFWSLFI